MMCISVLSGVVIYFVFYFLNTGVSVPQQFKMDFDLVLENINELNTLAGEGIAKIQHTTDGARLKVHPFGDNILSLYNVALMHIHTFSI